jgi:Zn-dependent alcohol dehydrogenase
MMQTTAAVLHAAGEALQVEKVELDDPGDHEVLVEVAACGVCHSDLHLAEAGSVSPVPVILGHEGAGTVVATGVAVSRVRPGDHVVTSLHACGRCRMCATGRMHLCEAVTLTGTGSGGAGTPVHLQDGTGVSRFAAGAFAGHALVHEDALVTIDDDIPFDLACLLACGLSTGWGAAVHRGKVEPGEVVVVWGAGGVGMAAVAGAAHAGASRVVAVDTSPWKTNQAAHHGATHEVVVAGLSDDEVAAAVREATGPRGADVTIVTVGVLTAGVFIAAYQSLARGGRLVTVAVGSGAPVPLSLGDLNIGEKAILGSLMGSASPKQSIAQLIALYRAGRLDLEAFVTARYPLEGINDAFADLVAGHNVRGVITFR